MDGEHVHVTTGARTEFSGEAQYRVNAERMTVLTLLLTLGMSTGLTLGFGIGGLPGVVAGLVAGFGLPVATVLIVVRWKHGRELLARLTMAIERPH